MANLAEKVAGGRRQDRVPKEGQERTGTFIVGLGKVASAFPREETMDGGQCLMLYSNHGLFPWESAGHFVDSMRHCPQNYS